MAWVAFGKLIEVSSKYPYLVPQNPSLQSIRSSSTHLGYRIMITDEVTVENVRLEHKHKKNGIGVRVSVKIANKISQV